MSCYRQDKSLQARRTDAEVFIDVDYVQLWNSLTLATGADLMNSLADSLVLGAPTPDRLKQAEAWVNKALAVIDTAKKENSDEPENLAHCDLVLAAALFNKASMREVGPMSAKLSRHC